jgi:hypothetical protein
METSLDTTNLMLSIIAAASVLEALAVIAVGASGLMAYKRTACVLKQIEARIEPTRTRVNDVLDDLKAVSSTVKEETERIDQAIHETLERVDDTARRVRTQVAVRTSKVVGFVRGVRVAIETLLEDRPARREART